MQSIYRALQRGNAVAYVSNIFEGVKIIWKKHSTAYSWNYAVKRKIEFNMKEITKKDVYQWELKAAIVNLEHEFKTVRKEKDEKNFKPEYRIFCTNFFTCFFAMFVLLVKAFSRKKSGGFIIIS